MVRFCFLLPLFFPRTTVIASGVSGRDGLSSISYGGKGVRVEVDDGIGCGGCRTAPSGISPSLSITNACEENVSEAVLNEGSRLSA